MTIDLERLAVDADYWLTVLSCHFMYQAKGNGKNLFVVGLFSNILIAVIT
jgi:hypothetical protein